jgi:2,4-dienoyl-CoA reductase-like NADH-dependent reductase (Old Yellow Enzyme family)/thioredoxin reductase
MQSKYTHVFAPIRIRGIDFKNRVTLAPPSPNLASTDGLITHDFVDWFRMFARGGAATLYVGNCSIDITECRDEAFQLDLSNPDSIRPMTWYSDMCKEYQCHASLEINHNGENTAFETVGHAPFSASSRITDNERKRAAENHREPIPCIEMSHAKIEETVEKYGKAAAMMKRAGMDICLVHGGHGNLISQFTSPLYNLRTDEYGGDTRSRARFAIEVCKSIREHCGEDFVIEYRISADEIAPGGMHFPETLELIGCLKDYIDIVHVSAGLHSDYNMAYYRNWCQNYLMDRCFNVHYAADIKKTYPDLLVNTVGSITSLDYAEEIIGSGQADFVAMCRPLMADPDMPRKYAENRPEDRRPCLRCDTCTKHLFIPKPIFCAVNPMSGMTSVLKDGRVPKAERKKRVAVVGGGPGGVQALQTLLDRGHDVTLYEKTGEIGGNLIVAAAPPFKEDLRDYVKWMRHTVDQCVARGAKVLLNTEATKELLDKEQYDALVIAVGAEPVVPEKIPGIHDPIVGWGPEADTDRVRSGDTVVVIGAGSVGLDAALSAQRKGCRVIMIEMDDRETTFQRDRQTGSNAVKEFFKILPEGGADMRFETRLLEVKPDGVVVEDLPTGRREELRCDRVLLATGMRALTGVVEELRRCVPETSCFFVGDCHKPDTIGGAVNEAFRACIHI